jgi:hypothetical protein
MMPLQNPVQQDAVKAKPRMNARLSAAFRRCHIACC